MRTLYQERDMVIKMSVIDLHVHSCYSDDGELSPERIIQTAKEHGIELIAITDHNSIKGVKEAFEKADGIKVISGVELDCTYRGRGFHLLGYHFDHERKEFPEIEEDILRQEREAAETKISLFRKATGIPIQTDEVLAAASGGVVTGELIGELLFARQDAASYDILKPYLPGGEKCDMPNVRFYWDFFAEGKAAYVPIEYISLPDAVRLIHSAEGKAVLAHPGQNIPGDDELLQAIIREKIDGLEAFSSYHSIEMTKKYAQVAEQNGLLATCGSDFHGKHKPHISLGGHGADELKERVILDFF